MNRKEKIKAFIESDVYVPMTAADIMHCLGVPQEDKDELLSALERAALVTEERIAGNTRSHVKLDINGHLLAISANSAIGSTYDEVEIVHEGGDMFIAFNNRYLIDSVRACRADRLTISLSSALTSINIEPEQNEEVSEDLFMLLPVRM